MTQQSFDVAISAPACPGASPPWLLSRAGARVAPVERMGPDGAGSAAHVAAAMLAPLAESAIAERRIVELGIASVDLWRAWWPSCLSRSSSVKMARWSYGMRATAPRCRCSPAACARWRHRNW